MASDPISDRLCVALDVNGFEEARTLIEQLAPHVGWFKFGSDLDENVPIKLVAQVIRENGCKPFLDDKFDDIPERVARKARLADRIGAAMFTVKASAGLESIKAAVAHAGGAKAVVVTVLTSMTEAQCADVYLTCSLDTTERLWGVASRAGAHGIVCAAPYVGRAASRFPWWTFVTPGIRPRGAEPNDQVLVGTPAGAVRSGTDLLVVGRPIIAPDQGTPLEAVMKIRAEIAAALAAQE